MVTKSKARALSRLVLAGVALVAWTVCGHAAEATTTAPNTTTPIGTASPLAVTTIAPPPGFLDPSATPMSVAPSSSVTTAPPESVGVADGILDVVRVGDNKLACEQLATEINALHKRVAAARVGEGDGMLASGAVAPAGGSSSPRSTGDVLVDAGAVAATTVLAGALPVIGPVAGAVVDRAVSGIREGGRDARAPDAKPAPETVTARKTALATAYTAAQRQQHLMQIFNAKGC